MSGRYGHCGRSGQHGQSELCASSAQSTMSTSSTYPEIAANAALVLIAVASTQAVSRSNPLRRCAGGKGLETTPGLQGRSVTI